MKTNIRTDYHFPAAVESVREARLLLGAWLAQWALNGELEQSLELVLGEAVSNAILHGSPAGAADSIFVSFERADMRLALTVQDQGTGFRYRGIHKPSPLDEHGRGLWFMLVFADGLEILPTANGTTVVVYKFLPAEVPMVYFPLPRAGLMASAGAA